MSHEKEAESGEAEDKGGGYVADNIYESTSDFWGHTDSSTETSENSSDPTANTHDSSDETTGYHSGRED